MVRKRNEPRVRGLNSTGSRQRLQLGDHLLVDGPLEMDDQAKQVINRDPAPLVEFGGVAGWREIDLAVVALKAHREPQLPLATITSAPGFSEQVRRQVVGVPV